MSITEKLAPCPFCGSSAHKGFSVIFCDGCEAKMESQHGEAACVEQWNRRATPAVEVTADAVEVADDVSGLMWELLSKVNAPQIDDRAFFVLSKAGVKACLSQVIGALIERAANTQEALSTMHTQYKEASAERETLSAANAHKQARIDSLMLEYCPDEMTPEQVENWGNRQRRASLEQEAAINAALVLDAAAAQAKQS